MELAGALQSSTQISYSRAPPPVAVCAGNCPDRTPFGPPSMRAVVDGDDGAQGDVGAGAVGPPSGGARAAASMSVP